MHVWGCQTVDSKEMAFGDVATEIDPGLRLKPATPAWRVASAIASIAALGDRALIGDAIRRHGSADDRRQARQELRRDVRLPSRREPANSARGPVRLASPIHSARFSGGSGHLLPLAVLCGRLLFGLEGRARSSAALRHGLRRRRLEPENEGVEQVGIRRGGSKGNADAASTF